jgi:hypothetical protein
MLVPEPLSRGACCAHDLTWAHLLLPTSADPGETSALGRRAGRGRVPQATVGAPSAKRSERWWQVAIVPIVAGALALTAAVAGWRGGDVPAYIYRIGLFHRDGLTLWDSQWYGGHWTLSYSTIFAPVAGLLGIQVTQVLSAAGAAWAFDRLAIGHFGTIAKVGSLLFAVGTLAQVAIGQLPFLLGEALALGALWAATRRRWHLSVPLAIASALASPLAAAFLVLAALAWLVASWPRHRFALAGLAAVPATVVAGLGLLFPGQGLMPFPAFDFLFRVVLILGALMLIPRQERALRAGAWLYLVATSLSFFVPTPMGGNINRLADCVAAPLAVCMLWPHRRRLLAFSVVPLVVMQWQPAFASFTADRSDVSTHAAYFTGLVDYLVHHDEPAGRVEIVPTKLHWESAYVAPVIPMARGWERQLDTSDNPIFYTPGALTPAGYLAWLAQNGVRYVGLADASVDYAGTREAQLVRSGLGGLRLVWTDLHWHVYQVVGSPGIVSGPGRLERLDGGQIVLNASRAGHLLVRVRYTSRWALTQGSACIGAAPGGWIAVTVHQPGRIELNVQLTNDQSDRCNEAA